MNSRERMNAAIHLQPVDRVPNAPFYEAPICNYFGAGFRTALLEGKAMADAHVAALEEFEFDWVMVGMGLIGGIIPEAMGCAVSYPEDAFPIIKETSVKSIADVDAISRSNVHTERMEQFLKGISLLKQKLRGDVPIACEYISPFTHGIMPGNLTQDTVLDLQKLKDKCGDRICIFDNLNPNGSLLIGTSDEVTRETRDHLEKARAMSGYIFSTSGTTSPNTPRVNFEAMNREVLKFSL